MIMASMCRNILKIIPKNNLRCMWGFVCSVQNTRFLTDNSKNRLTLMPKNPSRIKKRKTVKNVIINEEEQFVQSIHDDLESEFTENMMNLHGNEMSDQKYREIFNRDMNVDKHQLKKQIIKRKYFKPEKEENLLTWHAKEQIKFLHETYPEEWSVTALAGIFPVSVYGVSKIIKSNFYGVLQSKKNHHDKKIVAKWKQLSEEIKEKDNWEDERLNRITCAGGIPDLPFKDNSKSVQYEGRHPTPFSNILRRCVPTEKLLECTKTTDLESDKQTAEFHQSLLKQLFPQSIKISKPECDRKIDNNQFTESDFVGQISIPSPKRHKNKVYQKDKTVYDENGEFLYRIP